jgi:hypothetical protein
MPSHSLLVASLSILVAACTPKPADTDSSESGETAGTTGTGGAEVTSATAPTTTTATTSGASDSATGGTTTADPTTATTATVTTANPTTADPTADPTDGPEGPLLAACEALCKNLSMCGLSPDDRQCVPECLGEDEPGSECAKLATQLWSCASALSCEELQGLLDGDDSTACKTEKEAYDATCSDGVCGVGVGGGPDACSISLACPGLEQEYLCEVDTCTCVENSVPGETCPNPGLCGEDEPDFLALEEAAQACCGWDWS